MSLMASASGYRSGTVQRRFKRKFARHEFLSQIEFIVNIVKLTESKIPNWL